MNGNKFYCKKCHKVISVSNKKRHNEQRCWGRSALVRLYGK
jgi:hypothetical protein